MYEELEKHRQAQLEGLVAQYHRIGPLLTQIEEKVVDTNKGRAPQMRSYYHTGNGRCSTHSTRWCSVLATCRELLGDGPNGRTKPLFRVGTVLSAPEVLVSPPLAEVNKYPSKLLKSLVESTRSFVWWMDGTCLETPPQKVAGDDEEPVIFSFYNDVIGNKEIVGAMVSVTRTIERTFGRVNKQLDQYRRYDQLWRVDKTQHREVRGAAAVGGAVRLAPPELLERPSATCWRCRVLSPSTSCCSG